MQSMLKTVEEKINARLKVLPSPFSRRIFIPRTNRANPRRGNRKPRYERIHDILILTRNLRNATHSKTLVIQLWKNKKSTSKYT